MSSRDGLQRDVVELHGDPHSFFNDQVDRAQPLDDDDGIAAMPRGRKSKSLSSDGQPNRPNMEIRDLLARVSFLENQIAGSAHNEGSLSVLAANNRHDSLVDIDASLEENATQASEYAIEVLKGDPDYYYRSSKTSDKIVRAKDAAQNQNIPSAPRTPGGSGSSAAEISKQTPDRIRINSPSIMNVLAAMDRHVDATAPVIMLRPFKVLVHHERRIRDHVRHLEHEIQDYSLPDEESVARLKTLNDLQCLERFIDTFLTPTMTALNFHRTSKIRFQDLWLIFQPGEDIFMPLKQLRGAHFSEAMAATPETFVRRFNMLWRVTGTGGGRRDLAAVQNDDSNLKLNPFSVNCYYVDFDGRFFLPVVHTFSILPFSGEKEITSLDFYPVRFRKDGQAELLQHTSKGGETFKTILTTGFKHFYYTGLTTVTQPCGCPLQTEPMHQEFVDSEVIVDFKTSYLRHPSWRPKSNLWKRPPKHDGEVYEAHPVQYWKDAKKKKLASTDHDFIHDDYHIDRELSNNFRNNELIFAPIPSGWASNSEMVPEKDVGLLAGRVFAFVLRTRTFASLWVWSLSPIKPQKDSLNNLQLRDNGFKDTIQKLVNSHFKQASRANNFEWDVVQGKGRGLVILLHGAPGVGKTSTAESVAAACGKPLFQITTGDLGLTPSEVERSLKEIFRFAQLWNCVLLLDECDVFLAQRTKNDVVRNGLVSVFLRTLEFYEGVLFCTTNRVGVLDEAIRSRLTYTAYYPPLDENQTKEIWKVNLRLLKERNTDLDIDEKSILRFARDHFRANVETNSIWNGRQIQNAFKVATALAEWDDTNDEAVKASNGMRPALTHAKRRPKLQPSHFGVIAVGTHAFDAYLREATGYTDGERAYNEMVRADDHRVEPSRSQNIYDHNPSTNGHARRRSSASPAHVHRRPSGSLALQHFESNTANQYSGSQASRRLSASHHGIASSPHSLHSAISHGTLRRASGNHMTAHASIELQSQSPRSSGFWHDQRGHGDSDGRFDSNGPMLGSSDDDLEPDGVMQEDRRRSEYRMPFEEGEEDAGEW